jgi:hypothetical protein
MAIEKSGARFFDNRREDRGWASKVVRKLGGLAGLTVLDVLTNESGLAAFLKTLDRSPLLVQCTDTAGETYNFAWASGYENGAAIRIQGKLTTASPAPTARGGLESA